MAVKKTTPKKAAAKKPPAPKSSVEKAKETPALARKSSRSDTYGATGFGETRSGVMAKDLKAFKKWNDKLPKDVQATVSGFTKRGNIAEFYMGPGFQDYNPTPKKKKKK